MYSVSRLDTNHPPVSDECISDHLLCYTLRCRLVHATLLSATVNANAQVDTAALPPESGSDTFILLYA